MQTKLINFVQEIYQTKEFIPLHAPSFPGNEKLYLSNTIDSTFVSSVGKYVDQFELQIENYTSSIKATAVVNGTAALHAALYMAGVVADDLVITQALTFVATCNALYHMGASPVFVDVSKTSLGLCPKSLESYLLENAFIDDDGVSLHKVTKQVFRAVVPMHTFGHPAELDELLIVCKKWNIVLIEDAAESLGSFYKGKHTGIFGEYGAISFNGNKIITTGGGGVVLCQSQAQGLRTKHLTTTAKVPHAFEFIHDEAGFNYRMPNLNAALGCAQMEGLPKKAQQKRELAQLYKELFKTSEYQFFTEPDYAQSNYWLNTIICPDIGSRNQFLEDTNSHLVMTRPVWQLMHKLPMYCNNFRAELTNSEWLADRIVNIPSSAPNWN